ncbi:MAG: hypothetical protein A2498_07370 [Lentisphaerae bacterium RIFOXYC12_FULL_60_16]|nr:MAG: hypothetical protein A2498_07370 [Lentisphaerae bacterium RIFOXYC12_FULL_60_16]OGV85559.1 MAG: hypothetical protein A2340_12705 [Lentisphaerae bacterium RIFOXYB12_FULL_60_10]
MKRTWWLAVAILAGLMVFEGTMQAGEHFIGGGAHYFKTIDAIDNDDGEFDENGLAWVVSYQYQFGAIFKIQADLELLPEDYAGSPEKVWAPQAFLLLGRGLYAGLGVGTLYSDGEWADKPFYAIRAGLDLELLPRLHLDINANYYFNDWDSVNTLDEDVDSDTITIGAAARFQL